MPIRLIQPPRQAHRAVQETLSERAERSDFATRALRQAPAGELMLSAPHPVYTLRLSDLVEGKGLESAELTGWRYLVQRGDATIASAEIHTGAAGAGAAALEVNEGPFVGATSSAVAKAEELPQVDHEVYELRLLRIPALYLVALWLNAQGDAEDVLMPIGPTPPEVESERPYGPDELLKTLDQEARKQVEFDSSPDQGRQGR